MTPTAASNAVRLEHGTVGELYHALTQIMLDEGNEQAPVYTEVGLSGGKDCFVGSVAQSVRVEFGGRVIISADEVR